MNVSTFTYQRTLLHTLFCLFSKSSNAFNVSLRVLFRDTGFTKFISVNFFLFIKTFAQQLIYTSEHFHKLLLLYSNVQLKSSPCVLRVLSSLASAKVI